jgi:hypothetical protein
MEESSFVQVCAGEGYPPYVRLDKAPSSGAKLTVFYQFLKLNVTSIMQGRSEIKIILSEVYNSNILIIIFYIVMECSYRTLRGAPGVLRNSNSETLLYRPPTFQVLNLISLFRC